MMSRTVNASCYVRADDVAQLVEVGRREEAVVAVAALHVLVDAVQVQRHRVQQLQRVDVAVRGDTGRGHVYNDTSQPSLCRCVI